MAHVPRDEKTLMLAYLDLKAEAEADSRTAPTMGRGQTAWTPQHHRRARTTESTLTERIRAAKTKKRG